MMPLRLNGCGSLPALAPHHGSFRSPFALALQRGSCSDWTARQHTATCNTSLPYLQCDLLQRRQDMESPIFADGRIVFTPVLNCSAPHNVIGAGAVALAPEDCTRRCCSTNSLQSSSLIVDSSASPARASSYSRGALAHPRHSCDWRYANTGSIRPATHSSNECNSNSSSQSSSSTCSGGLQQNHERGMHSDSGCSAPHQ